MSTQCNKLLQLHNIVALNEPGVIAITETWLTSCVADTELFPSGYSVHRKDREATVPGKTGGGVLLAINDNIVSSRREDLEPDDEILVCEMKPDSRKKIAIVVVYRPPNGNVSAFCRNLDNTLKKVVSQYDSLCLMGDFNCPSVWSAGNFSLNRVPHLCDCICQQSLSQINYVPSNVQGNLLDLVFTNVPERFSEVTELPDTFNTDHTLLSFSMEMGGHTKRKITRTVYNYKQADFARLRAMLSNLSLAEVLNICNDPDHAWQTWSEAVTECIDCCVPKTTVKNSNAPPWIDKEIRHLQNVKRTAWRKAKIHDSPTHWAKFRRLRNELQSNMSQKYNVFLDSLAVDADNNTKRLWSFIRTKTKSSSVPKNMTHGSLTETESGAKAKLFNDYFYSVFRADPVSQSLPDIQVKVDSRLSSVDFSVREIEKIMLGLDHKKACGPDGISPLILKQCAHELAPSLSVMFNLSMSKSRVPSQWKDAHVVPIFKKGKRNTVDNYRPVSLLSVVSKIMERCTYNHVYSVIKRDLYPFQHGFVKGKSCSTQLLEVYHQIGSVLDRAGQVDMVCLDFSKAFDSVPHSLMVHKLKSFGVNGSLLDWFSSYLCDRRQRVVLEGEASGWLPVISGVPQGSILGPLLFLLYINDMSDVVSSSTLALFADDSKCFSNINNISDCLALQRDLDSLCQWARTWQLNFNVKKCSVLNIARRRRVDFVYTLNGIPLASVDSFKDLGISVTPTLSWGVQIQNIVNKCNRIMGMVKRSVGFGAAHSVKQKLYESLVRSHLEYSSCVWAPHLNCDIRAVEAIQRSATRYILNYPAVLSYPERCASLNLLPLSFRREISDLMFLFKCMYGDYDLNLLNYVTFVSTETSLRSANNGRVLTIPRVRTETFMSSYFNRVVFMWNNLPLHIRNCVNINSFKRAITQYYGAKLVAFDVNNVCTWSSVCRCSMCVCNRLF